MKFHGKIKEQFVTHVIMYLTAYIAVNHPSE